MKLFLLLVLLTIFSTASAYNTFDYYTPGGTFTDAAVNQENEVASQNSYPMNYLQFENDVGFLAPYQASENDVGRIPGILGPHQATENDVGMGYADYRRSEAEVGNRRNRVRELGRAHGYKSENQVGAKADSENDVAGARGGFFGQATENDVAGGRECQLMGYPCTEDEAQVGAGEVQRAHRSGSMVKDVVTFFAGVGFTATLVYAYNIWNAKKGMEVHTALLNRDIEL